MKPKPAARERILLVDDEDLVRMMIKSVLGFSGYQVVEAEDGLDAVEKFRAASPKIDLVLMDYHLPRLNGQEALLRLREIEPGLPAILLSGGLHDGMERMAGLEDVTFLHKPFENDELLRAMRGLLDGRAG